MFLHGALKVGEGLHQVAPVLGKVPVARGLVTALGPTLLPFRELLGYVREQLRPAGLFSLYSFHGGSVMLFLG